MNCHRFSSTEHSRVQLAGGTLVDLFCSMYCVSCKVLTHLFPYFCHFIFLDYYYFFFTSRKCLDCFFFCRPSWLPPVSRQDGESTQEFANKVQEVRSVKKKIRNPKFSWLKSQIPGWGVTNPCWILTGRHVGDIHLPSHEIRFTLKQI